MSEGPRLPLKEARKIADGLVEDLRPYCERIEIAGSVRRKKADVGDLEICCIPKIVQGLDLFGGEGEQINLLEGQLHTYHILKGKDRYKKIRLASIDADIFMTTADCWGVIFTIRTGSAEFSHKLVTPKNQGGLLPSYLQVADGRVMVRSTKELCNTPEERDLFELIGLPWIEPEKRI